MQLYYTPVSSYHAPVTYTCSSCYALVYTCFLFIGIYCTYFPLLSHCFQNYRSLVSTCFSFCNASFVRIRSFCFTCCIHLFHSVYLLYIPLSPLLHLLDVYFVHLFYTLVSPLTLVVHLKVFPFTQLL